MKFRFVRLQNKILLLIPAHCVIMWMGPNPNHDHPNSGSLERYLREWRKQCFLRFLVRGIRPKQANTIFSTIF